MSSVTEESYYSQLVKKEDKKDYQKSGFNRSRVPHFKFVILLRITPEEEWLDKTYPIQVIPVQSGGL